MAVARTKRVIRRDWTRDEVKELKKHSKGKTPVKTVSRALKRTSAALRQKSYALGISLGPATKGSERERPLSEVREPGSTGLLPQATITPGLNFGYPGVSGGPLLTLTCGDSFYVARFDQSWAWLAGPMTGIPNGLQSWSVSVGRLVHQLRGPAPFAA
jgi:hypothetical protein